jgi:hypothetical protein
MEAECYYDPSHSLYSFPCFDRLDRCGIFLVSEKFGFWNKVFSKTTLMVWSYSLRVFSPGLSHLVPFWTKYFPKHPVPHIVRMIEQRRLRMASHMVRVGDVII